MVSKVLILATFILSAWFCFQHHVTHSEPKIDDSVWFEEPDTYQFSGSLIANNFQTEAPFPPSKLEEFETQHDIAKVKVFAKVKEETKDKEDQKTVTVENPSENDDAKFTEFFLRGLLVLVLVLVLVLISENQSVQP